MYLKVEYTLAIKIVDSGRPITPVAVLATDSNNSVLNLIGAANAILDKTILMFDRCEVNDFGEIERDEHNIRLNSCIWQYFEENKIYIGYIELDDEIPLHILCFLKER